MLNLFFMTFSISFYDINQINFFQELIPIINKILMFFFCKNHNKFHDVICISINQFLCPVTSKIISI